MFLKKVSILVVPHTVQDSTANAILSHYHHTEKTALRSTGDGDCLFISVSTLLIGDESKSVELHLRCCVEMIVNRTKIMRHRLGNSLWSGLFKLCYAMFFLLCVDDCSF